MTKLKFSNLPEYLLLLQLCQWSELLANIYANMVYSYCPLPSVQDAWHVAQSTIESLSLINSAWPCCSQLCIMSSSSRKLPCSALTSLLHSAVMLLYPFLCGHLYVHLIAKWMKYKMCFIWSGDLEFKGMVVKIYQAGFMLAPCAQEQLLLLMWDLDFGRRTYLCWNFTSYSVLTGGVCGLSFFKASCWLDILLFSWG